MSNNRFLPSAHPIWGVPMHMNVSDFSRSSSVSGFPTTPALDQVETTTKSAALNIGAMAVEMKIEFQGPGVVCDLNLYTVEDGEDTLVWSKTGVSHLNCAGLFAGNLERVALEGKPIKLEVANPAGGWVTAYVKLSA